MGSGGSVICKEWPGRDVGGHLTRTRLVPAWTVNSAPGLTPGGTVTRYTCPGPVVVRVTAYAPGRDEAAGDVAFADGGAECPPEATFDECASGPGGAEAAEGAEAASPPTVDPLTTTLEPAIPGIPPMVDSMADDNRELEVPPPTRGGTPGIPDGGENTLVDQGSGPPTPGAAPGGPTPEPLIPGYVCRLIEAWLPVEDDLCCCG